MKFLRAWVNGAVVPGVLDNNGVRRNISALAAYVTSAQISGAGLAQIKSADLTALPEIAADAPLVAPWADCKKFICIGLNYADHAAESGLPIPPEPIIFTKSIDARVGPNHDVVLPQGSVKGDWEVELGVVIGQTARYVEQADALNYVAGYCVVNDVSEREYQIERGGTWDKGKGCDTFVPVGPWLVTTDEVTDPQGLGMWFELNGKRYQNGSTKTMIFGVAELVSYVSRFMTLYPGYIISTGTPPGVGMGVKPNPVFLKAGDQMRLGIDGLGEQTQNVVALDPARIDAIV